MWVVQMVQMGQKWCTARLEVCTFKNLLNVSESNDQCKVLQERFHIIYMYLFMYFFLSFSLQTVITEHFPSFL